MTRTFATLFLIFSCNLSFAQNSSLSINQIMEGGDFVGHLPDNHYWSDDGAKIYFDWNPENAETDSLYCFSLESKKIEKISEIERELNLGVLDKNNYNQGRTKKVYSKDGDIYIQDLSNNSIRILSTRKNVVGLDGVTNCASGTSIDHISL